MHSEAQTFSESFLPKNPLTVSAAPRRNKKSDSNGSFTLKWFSKTVSGQKFHYSQEYALLFSSRIAVAQSLFQTSNGQIADM